MFSACKDKTLLERNSWSFGCVRTKYILVRGVTKDESFAMFLAKRVSWDSRSGWFLNYNVVIKRFLKLQRGNPEVEFVIQPLA